MKLGILGGTFNPIHRGHLAVARAARELHGLEKVLIVPSGLPPHKETSDLAPAEDRLEMARLAAEGDSGVEVSDLEVRRPGVSYTVETLEALGEMHPRAELFFIVGADSVAELPSWRNLPRIAELARIVIVNRPDSPIGLSPEVFRGVSKRVLAAWRRDRVSMPPVSISSTRVRERIRRGESVEDALPRAVRDYIRQKGLYR